MRSDASIQFRSTGERSQAVSTPLAKKVFEGAKP
jgi:hypothetical protein